MILYIFIILLVILIVAFYSYTHYNRSRTSRRINANYNGNISQFRNTSSSTITRNRSQITSSSGIVDQNYQDRSVGLNKHTPNRNQFLRNRSTNLSSRINYISPNSSYGYLPKSSIKSEKTKEISREFTIKLSPFPQINRNFSNQNIKSSDSILAQSPNGINVTNSLLNENVSQSNETPTQSSSFNRSLINNKRPIICGEDSEDELLFKKSKNLLMETEEFDTNDMSGFDQKFKERKSLKRWTNVLDNDRQFVSPKKRVKNNEIFSSYSSNSIYYNRNFNKRKFSPDILAPNEFSKNKKRSYIEELEFLASDTSPYYKNIYSTPNDAKLKTFNKIDKVDPSDSKLFPSDDESENKQFQSDVVDEEDMVSIEPNAPSTEVEQQKTQVEPSEDQDRLYPIPVHVYSIKDHEYDRKKTKNRLDRFLAAVQQSSPDNNFNENQKESTEKSETKLSSNSISNTNLATSTFAVNSLPKVELNTSKPVVNNFAEPIKSSVNSSVTTSIVPSLSENSKLEETVRKSSPNIPISGASNQPVTSNVSPFAFTTIAPTIANQTAPASASTFPAKPSLPTNTNICSSSTSGNINFSFSSTPNKVTSSSSSFIANTPQYTAPSQLPLSSTQTQSILPKQSTLNSSTVGSPSNQTTPKLTFNFGSSNVTNSVSNSPKLSLNNPSTISSSGISQFVNTSLANVTSQPAIVSTNDLSSITAKSTTSTFNFGQSQQTTVSSSSTSNTFQNKPVSSINSSASSMPQFNFNSNASNPSNLSNMFSSSSSTLPVTQNSSTNSGSIATETFSFSTQPASTSSMFSFNSPPTTVSAINSKPSAGFNFNSNSVSFDFKQPLNQSSAVTNTGFNFSSAASGLTPSSTGFNFGQSVAPSNPTPSSTSTSAVPFSFSANSAPTFTFGTPSGSNTNMFSFKST